MGEQLWVDPKVLDEAAKGINGVIQGISGAPVVGSYVGQTGRGFSDLALTGMQASADSAKSGMSNFCDRWEWGTRALIQTANLIAAQLGISAGMYANQDKYASDALKSVVNDVVGDPSLQQQSYRGADGKVVPGTDDMSWSALLDHNVNLVTHSDYSVQSFEAVKGSIESNLKTVAENTPKAVMTANNPAASMALDFADKLSPLLQGH